MKRILALDLGTKMGLAWNRTGCVAPQALTKVLGTRAEIRDWGSARWTRRCDPRVSKVFGGVWQQASEGIDIIVFEDVQFSSSTYQTQLWASFRGAVWCAAAMCPSVSVECVPTGTLKKFATGHGGANKAMMESSLFRLHPEWKDGKLDDNGIDALWLWYWAQQHLLI